MISRLKTYSPFYIPILVGGLLFHRRQHIFNYRFFEIDIKYKPIEYHKKLLNCLECHKLSKTQICFSCWMKISGYPDSI